MRGKAALGALTMGALFFYIYLGAVADAEAGEPAFDVDTSGADNWGETMSTGNLSNEGLDALKRREGFSATSYPDHKGRSIGYGHLIKPGEVFNEPISRELAESVLALDVGWAVEAVNDTIAVPITQNQFDALVSFCFNVGAGAFKKSTLVRQINEGNPDAAKQFARWVYASGAVNSALVSRRADEATQFLA